MKNRNVILPGLISLPSFQPSRRLRWLKHMACVIGASLLAATASADFTGLWLGAGVLYQDGKRISECQPALLHFRNSATELETIRGEVNCRPMIIRSKPKITPIVGGKLFFNGEPVGTITDNEIVSEYWDKKAGWTHKFRLVRSGNSIQYYEQVVLQNGYEYYRVEAVLNLQSR